MVCCVAFVLYCGIAVRICLIFVQCVHFVGVCCVVFFCGFVLFFVVCIVFHFGDRDMGHYKSFRVVLLLLCWRVVISVSCFVVIVVIVVVCTGCPFGVLRFVVLDYLVLCFTPFVWLCFFMWVLCFNSKPAVNRQPGYRRGDS